MLQILLPILAQVLQRVIPDEAQRAQAQNELTQALLQGEQALMQHMAAVMQADAASESWLTRSTRPIVVLWGLFMLTFVGVIAPAVGIQAEVVAGLTGIPGELWSLVTVGVGIWTAGRSLEKSVASFKKGG